MKFITDEHLDLLVDFDEEIKNVYRQRRIPYIEAYNIVMNNHRNGARNEDILSDSEYQEITTWFNELRDVTDTLDTSVFERIPQKVLKHIRRWL